MTDSFPLSLGSLCTGYGGLDLAAAQVLDVRPVWVADPDPGAAAVLAHRFPAVLNLGDITALDFGQVPRVDVVCAGFPCQDLSYAGRGAGIAKGTRSGLWHVIAHAVGVLRPRHLILENVAGVVARRPGLDVVLGDLSQLGFAAEWMCVRASDVGAPHARNRWFLLATDPTAHPAAGGPVADTARDRRHQGRPESAGEQGRPDAALGRDDAGADLQGFGHRHAGTPRQEGMAAPAVAGAVADPGRVGRQGHRPAVTHRRPVPADPAVWGRYAPAIARWEHLTGRPTPDPTEPGRDHRPRLAPRFVEWLMGLPDGWVTDVPGLSRNRQLTLLGNGVVPRQGAAALTALADRLTTDTPPQRSAA